MVFPATFCAACVNLQRVPRLTTRPSERCGSDGDGKRRSPAAGEGKVTSSGVIRVNRFTHSRGQNSVHDLGKLFMFIELPSPQSLPTPPGRCRISGPVVTQTAVRQWVLFWSRPRPDKAAIRNHRHLY